MISRMGLELERGHAFVLFTGYGGSSLVTTMWPGCRINEPRSGDILISGDGQGARSSRGCSGPARKAEPWKLPIFARAGARVPSGNAMMDTPWPAASRDPAVMNSSKGISRTRR